MKNTYTITLTLKKGVKTYQEIIFDVLNTYKVYNNEEELCDGELQDKLEEMFVRNGDFITFDVMDSHIVTMSVNNNLAAIFQYSTHKWN